MNEDIHENLLIVSSKLKEMTKEDFRKRLEEQYNSELTYAFKCCSVEQVDEKSC